MNRPVRSRRRRRNFRQAKKSRCRFCNDGVDNIDYKDLNRLRKLITGRGLLMSRKRSGNCAPCQRKVRTAVKRARFLGLFPYED